MADVERPCPWRRMRLDAVSRPIPLMDHIPDTAQPDHAQLEAPLPARDRPRHPRAFEPRRNDELASGLRNARPSGSLQALVAVVAHPRRARFDVTIRSLVERG